MINHLSAKSSTDDFGPGPPPQAINHLVTKLRWGWEKTEIPEGSAEREGKERPLVFSLYSHNLLTATLRKERVWSLVWEPGKREPEEENHLPEGGNTRMSGKPGLQQGEKVPQTYALGPEF